MTQENFLHVSGLAVGDCVYYDKKSETLSFDRGSDNLMFDKEDDKYYFPNLTVSNFLNLVYLLAIIKGLVYSSLDKKEDDNFVSVTIVE